MSDFQTPKTVSIVGIGKLGLCFALNLEQRGVPVLAYDIRPDYLKALEDKTFNSDEAGVNELLQKATKISYTTDLADIVKNDIVFIFVQTPSLPTGEYDHSRIDDFFNTIRPLVMDLDHRIDFIISCTTMPGYTEQLRKRIKFDECKIEHKISYNPEFIAQGTIIRDQQYPDMVLIGQADQEAGDKMEMYYKKIILNNPEYKRMSPTEAEITKIALNCFVTTKIAFANMVGSVAKKSHCDPDVILHAIGSDTRIGNKYFKWGFGFGGPCFPRDNRAFGIFCNSMDVTPTIPFATDDANKEHAKHYADHIYKNLVDNTWAIEHATYKKESTIIEESQILETAKILHERGVNIIIRERKKVIDDIRKQFGDIFAYEVRD